MDCDTFGPKRIGSQDIWSPTIGPQIIGPSGQTVPNKFSPHGQMVPQNSVPMDKWSTTNLVPLENVPKIFHLSRGTCCGDPEMRGPNWESFVQGGPNFFGDHLSIGTKYDGDYLSRGKESGGPEVQ